MTGVRAIFATAAALVCVAGMSAQAQTWPSRPVRIIAPFRQQFFIENRGGAGGIIGAQAGAAAEPDGYTLVISSIASNVISPVFHANAGYDGLRDFTHIAYL